MSTTDYTRIAAGAISGDTELSVMPSPEEEEEEEILPLTKSSPIALGQPQQKSYFSNSDLLAVLGSCLCLAVSICVVTPYLTLSWRLGYEGQIVVIGFLMSIMAICMKTVAPTLFLVLEARWGSSTLQNYDAIIRNTMLASQTGVHWRGAFLLLAALPLGLSAAYKRFTNGISSADITNPFNGHYGLVSAPQDNGGVMNNTIYYMIEANMAFLAASSNDSNPPPFLELPKAYGYNTLLIDNVTAALLDMPHPEYVNSIQQKLSVGETWNVSASVNGTVTTYNTSGDVYIKNDSFWNHTFNHSNGGFESWELYNGGLALGVLFANPGEEGTYCFAANYPSTVRGFAKSRKPMSEDSLKFRRNALMFNTRRQKCFGSWKITRNSITLLDGYCTPQLTNQSIFGRRHALPSGLGALSVLVHSIGSGFADRRQSPWLRPAFTVAISTSYWSRFAYDFAYNSAETRSTPEIYYPPTDELIVSSTTTLDANWLLYVVLSLQPILTLLMVLFAMFLHYTPIQNGFGIVAILAGVDRGSLDIVQGAGLSGKLAKPVVMDIAVRKPEKGASHHQFGSGLEHMLYILGSRRSRNTTKLEKDKKYG